MSMGIPNPLLFTGLLSAIIWPFPQEGGISPRYITATPHRYPPFNNFCFCLYFYVGSWIVFVNTRLVRPATRHSASLDVTGIEGGRSLIQEVDLIIIAVEKQDAFMNSHPLTFFCAPQGAPYVTTDSRGHFFSFTQPYTIIACERQAALMNSSKIKKAPPGALYVSTDRCGTY